MYDPAQPGGGTPRPYTYLSERFLPQLRRAGVDEADITAPDRAQPVRRVRPVGTRATSEDPGDTPLPAAAGRRLRYRAPRTPTATLDACVGADRRRRARTGHISTARRAWSMRASVTGSVETIG